MDTPPYSDASAQLSPGAHALHVNGDSHSSTATNTIPHTTGAIASMDVPSLYSASWSALDIPPPPTLREILTAYKQKGDGDRDMLLAMLNAKSAEDQRIASQLSLRRTMLEISNQTTEPRTHPHPHLHPHPHPHPHHPFPHATVSHGLGRHAYTYVPDESYTLPGPHQQHRIASSSPPALPHSYPSAYGHGHAPHAHSHLRAIDSPPLSASAQKGAGALPVLRSRGAARLSDTRSQSQSQFQTQNLSQSQRRKRARRSRSRSRSPIVSPSRHPYAYVRPPHSHSRTHSEADPDLERSPYTSASDSGSTHGHGQGLGQGQGQGYPRTMAIGSLLSAGSNPNGSGPNANGPNGAAAGGRVKEECAEREQGLEDEHEEAWTRERPRSRDER